MRSALRATAVATLAAATMSCGSVVRDSRSPVLLIIDSLVGAQGNHPAAFGGSLTSDVLTLVTSPSPCSAASPCSTIFNDIGQATFHFNPKQQPTTNNPFGPTSTNEVTITRYRVVYVRADGRNVPGVDVPYPFDGGVTGTIPVGSNLTVSFELVRHAAKQESPLVQLQTSPTVITTIAQVTFYAHDTVGNELTATGSMTIAFGNFGDT